MEMSKNNEAYAISDRCGLDAGLERPVTRPPGEMCPSLGYSFTFRGSSRMALFTVMTWGRVASVAAIFPNFGTPYWLRSPPSKTVTVRLPFLVTEAGSGNQDSEGSVSGDLS